MFSIKIQGIEAVRAQLTAVPGLAAIAVAKSINETLAFGKQFAAEAVSQHYNVTQDQVQRGAQVKQASPSDLNGTLGFTGKGMVVIKMGAVDNYPEGVNVYILRGKQTNYPKAFIATMPSGHRGVYQRKKGAGRLPIYEKFGPSFSTMVKEHSVFPKIQQAMNEKLAAQLTANSKTLTS